MIFLNKYQQLIIPVFFLAYLLIGLSVLPDYGMSWDEAAQRNHGIVAFDYINEVLDLGHEKQRPQSNLMRHSARHYGLWFPLMGYGLENLFGLSEDFRGRFLMRHIMVFLLFWIATIFFFKLLKNRFDDWKTGLLGTTMLILSPRIFAHSFFNPKDIVLLSCYLITTYTLIRFFQKTTIKHGVFHAVACAFVVNSRVPGIIIPTFTLGIILIDFLQNKFSKDLLNKYKFSLPTFIFATLLFTILLNPSLWKAPTEQFTETFQSMSKFDWSSHLLFNGEFILGTELPWHYVPTWITISTPIVYLFFFIIGAFFVFKNGVRSLIQLQIWQNKNELIDVILFSLFLLPILAVIIKGSTLYDGWRQLFFVYPSMIGVTTLGFVRLANYKKIKAIIFLIFAFGLLQTGFRMTKEHPFQYLYFNAFAGDDLLERYDRDYWGLSYRQAIEELIKRYPYSCKSVKMKSYPGEENFRFFGTEIRQHLDLKYGPQTAEFHISNYRGWKELGDFKKGRFPYQNEVFSIDVQGSKVVGVYRDIKYKDITQEEK